MAKRRRNYTRRTSQAWDAGLDQIPIIGEIPRDNVAGFFIGTFIFFLMIWYFGSAVGPFAGDPLQTQFGIFYNNTKFLMIILAGFFPLVMALGLVREDYHRKQAPMELEQEE